MGKKFLLVEVDEDEGGGCGQLILVILAFAAIIHLVSQCV
jgi:hypothetical protein